MSTKELGIKYKRVEQLLAVTARQEVKERREIWAALDDLARSVPAESITGPGLGIFQFVTSIQNAYDVEIALPVAYAVEGAKIIPAIQVLSLVYRGPVEGLREGYVKLYGSAAQRGIISDEFGREVYHDVSDPQQVEIELQFIVHGWTGLLAENLERVLGRDALRSVMPGSEKLTLESTVDERFAWAKRAIERLNDLASPGQVYDVLSSCAHIFPASQIDKLRAVYAETKAQTGDGLQAVDAVIEFMAQDPGWGERPRREGRVIYSAKNPRDQQGYETAQTELERRQAYCFCPLIRTHLESGMPLDFCYCGSGWYRQQWEGAIGAPVQIEIVQSVLRGDACCEFAIRLPNGI